MSAAIRVGFIFSNKMKKKTHHALETDPKSNRKTGETGAKLITITHKCTTSHLCGLVCAFQ
jgi:hypothetical protein